MTPPIRPSIARLKAAQARAAQSTYIDAGGQVTPCPPGEAHTSSATFRYSTAQHAHLRGAAARMQHHVIDKETGEARPTRSRRVRGGHLE